MGLNKDLRFCLKPWSLSSAEETLLQYSAPGLSKCLPTNIKIPKLRYTGLKLQVLDWEQKRKGSYTHLSNETWENTQLPGHMSTPWPYPAARQEQGSSRHHSPGVLISHFRIQPVCRQARVCNTFLQAQPHEPWGTEQGAHTLQFNSPRLYVKWCFTNRLKGQTGRNRQGIVTLYERDLSWQHSHKHSPLSSYQSPKQLPGRHDTSCTVKLNLGTLIPACKWQFKISHPLENLEGQGTNSFYAPADKLW